MSLFSRFSKTAENPDEKPQRWQVTYSVDLINNGPTDQPVSLILPVPRSISSQKLESQPTFSTPPTSTELDNVYANQYAVWALSLKPKQQITISETINITTNPVKHALPSGMTLASYVGKPRVEHYCKPNRFIEPNNLQIQKLAANLSSGVSDLAKIIESFNQYLLDNLTYGNPIPGLYRAQDAIRSLASLGTVGVPTDCGGYDTLLVSMLNTCGIPARIVSGFWLRPSTNYSLQTTTSPPMHAWVEILLPDGSWLPADPSVEQLRRFGRSKKIGGLGELGSDRLITSVGCDLTLDVGGQKLPVDILQCPLLYPANPEIILNYSVSGSLLKSTN